MWWIEMSKMLTNFTFNLPFCCKVSHSGITSSAFSLPLSEKHIGAELASCLPPSPSATIILRYHPTFWPSSLWGGGEGKGRREAGKGREDGEHAPILTTLHVGGARTNLDQYPDRIDQRAPVFPIRVDACPTYGHPPTRAWREPCAAAFTEPALQLHEALPINRGQRAALPSPHALGVLSSACAQPKPSSQVWSGHRFTARRLQHTRHPGNSSPNASDSLREV